MSLASCPCGCSYYPPATPLDWTHDSPNASTDCHLIPLAAQPESQWQTLEPGMPDLPIDIVGETAPHWSCWPYADPWPYTNNALLTMNHGASPDIVQPPGFEVMDHQPTLLDTSVYSQGQKSDHGDVIQFGETTLDPPLDVVSPCSETFKCEWENCSFLGTFGCKTDLVDHVGKHHTSRMTGRCQWKDCSCPTIFSRSGDLKRHTETQHTCRTMHRCPLPECESEYNRRDNLRKHWRTKHERLAGTLTLEEYISLDVSLP
ncbi:hypothetical protein N7466_002237 [Penicillium verhagenii]|uniref:uncharacterized protein n=1 Tax=Penicillium verhagenii TaxID=1562060 RepID=UPI0025458949|nr:uncharacterized protein N7466_002237 [Penicillium verhagenii]KAJ5939103.1 hypothetical protein N7466_002237 [Penicillium verhagenii]